MKKITKINWIFSSKALDFSAAQCYDGATKRAEDNGHGIWKLSWKYSQERMIPIINIIDNIMGKGKSSAALQYINDNKDKRYLYVAPYLSECQRV